MIKIPLGEWVEAIVAWLEGNLGWFFKFLSLIITNVVDSFSTILHFLPAWFLILLIAIHAFQLGRWKMASLSTLGLLLILNFGYWESTMDTTALVLTSALLSIILGLPLGIWSAKNDTVNQVVKPLLDLIQTMPAFVYLIPAVTFFGLGVVPGTIASVIFAIAPTIHLTNLGIRQVPKSLIEAAESFGSTQRQKLLQVQLPLALPNIMAGINQTIMLSLSMVVISSMIGAEGVGAEVYRAVTQLKIGSGFEAGLVIVILAILLDRFSQKAISIGRRSPRQTRRQLWLGGILVLAMLTAGIFNNLGIKQKKELIGIEPGTGLMLSTEKAIKDYGLTAWTLKGQASAMMTAALAKAIKEKKPIVVTGWTPHWMFLKYDLKFLDDPKKSFGNGDNIHTIVRLGLKESQPEAYQFLKRFSWSASHMENVMLKISEGEEPEKAAAQWVKENEKLVNQWITGLSTSNNGETIRLAYVAWDSEIASTNVVKTVLEEKLGFKVKMLQVDIGSMWAGIADGSADAMVAAWMPSTSKTYLEKYKQKVEDLGANLRGTRVGLVVPKYMDINSIEDLK